jgi:hypothetical protein
LNDLVLADLFSESEQSSFTEVNHSRFSDQDDPTQSIAEVKAGETID